MTRATKVYLAGGIEGLPREVAAGWRTKLASVVIKAGGVPLDPMRRQLFSEGGDASAIFSNDFADIEDSQVFAANLLHGTCTGTKIELGLAWGRCKHILLLVKPHEANHPFYTSMGQVFTDELEFMLAVADCVKG